VLWGGFMKKAFLAVVSLLSVPFLTYAQDSSGPVSAAFFVNSAYCEIMHPCGSVGVYIENESDFTAVDGESENEQSSFMEIYWDNLDCGEEQFTIRFAPLPQKAKQVYKTNPFAQNASVRFHNLRTKDLTTRATHVLGFVDVFWEGGIPEFNTSYKAGFPAEVCSSYLVTNSLARLSLRLDGEIIAEDASCDVALRLDISCASFFP